MRPNYAFKPIAEQALRSDQTVVPQRLNAALELKGVVWSRKVGIIAAGRGPCYLGLWALIVCIAT